jgi:hypothetical protein
MSGRERPEHGLDHGDRADATAGSGTLIPMMPRTERHPVVAQPCRPSSVFVTHLIATAEQVPQTRTLRRATPADAQTAYEAHRPAPQRAGLRTRQVI